MERKRIEDELEELLPAAQDRFEWATVVLLTCIDNCDQGRAASLLEHCVGFERTARQTFAGILIAVYDATVATERKGLVLLSHMAAAKRRPWPGIKSCMPVISVVLGDSSVHVEIARVTPRNATWERNSE